MFIKNEQLKYEVKEEEYFQIQESVQTIRNIQEILCGYCVAHQEKDLINPLFFVLEHIKIECSKISSLF